MGDVVIVAYRPRPGCAAALAALVTDHVPRLRRLGLATARQELVLAAQDGVVVEVFEWEDGAIARAHEHPDVLAMWEAYAAVCTYVPFAMLPEAANPFARFKPVS